MLNNPSGIEIRRSVGILIITLIVISFLITAWRTFTEENSSIAPGDQVWDVEISVTADATQELTKISIAAPLGTRHLRTIGQNINYRGWRQSVPFSREKQDTRRIRLTASQSGEISAQVAFNVYQSVVPRLTDTKNTVRLDSANRDYYLRDHPLLEIEHPDVSEFIARLKSGVENGENLVDSIFLSVNRLRDRSDGDLRSVTDILAGESANRRERSYTMIGLCRAARIPARLVKGFILSESNPAQLHFWVEVHWQDQWIPFDPVFNHRGSVPDNYLPFVKGIKDVVAVSDTAKFSIVYSVTNSTLLMDTPDSTSLSWSSFFDFTRLSLETRILLAVMMLLPFGVLLTAISSELIGLRFYGVFTPSLLAMSLAYVPWKSAAMVFFLVLLFGVVGRSFVPEGLSRISRLSIVFVLVILGIGISASLMEYLGITFGDLVLLLPVVVLVSLVDRFYTVLDEKGFDIAIYRLGWTLVIAVLCLPVVQYEALGHFMLRYPELHLTTLGTILALSLYRGKTLSQVSGFTWLDLQKTKQKVQEGSE